MADPKLEEIAWACGADIFGQSLGASGEMQSNATPESEKRILAALEDAFAEGLRYNDIAKKVEDLTLEIGELRKFADSDRCPVYPLDHITASGFHGDWRPIGDRGRELREAQEAKNDGE